MERIRSGPAVNVLIKLRRFKTKNITNHALGWTFTYIDQKLDTVGLRYDLALIPPHSANFHIPSGYDDAALVTSS